MLPLHYHTSSNPPRSSKRVPRRSSVRSLHHRLREVAKRCETCGYDKLLAVLQVHHRDHNHHNNAPENLAVLCPTCHAEHHYLTRSGSWQYHAPL